MTGKIYHIAIIGAGRMGQRWAEAISKHKRLRLGLVIDKDKKRGLSLARRFAAPYANKASQETFNRHGIEAVFVATPHKYLSAYAALALSAGKHVLLEKPGALLAGDMKKLLQLAARQRAKLMLGLNYRFFNATGLAKKLADKKAVGKILFIRLRHGIAARPDYEKEWRMNKNLSGGGVLMDQGSHLIDLVNWLLPAPITEVKSVMSNSFLQTKVEDNAFVVLKNRLGQLASISVGLSEWEPLFCLEIYGARGFIRVDGIGRKYGREEKLTIVKAKRGKKFSKRVVVCDPDYEAMLGRMLNEFVGVLDGKIRRYPSGQDALKVLEIVGKIYNANRL